MLNEAAPNLPEHLKPLGCRTKASPRVRCIPWGCSRVPQACETRRSCRLAGATAASCAAFDNPSFLRAQKYIMKPSLFLFKRLFKFSAHSSFPHAINQCPPSAAQPFAHPRLSPAGRSCGSRVPDTSSRRLQQGGVGIKVAKAAFGQVLKSFCDAPGDKGGSVYSGRSTELGGMLGCSRFQWFYRGLSNNAWIGEVSRARGLKPNL